MRQLNGNREGQSCTLIKWPKSAHPWTTHGIYLKKAVGYLCRQTIDRRKKGIHCILNEYLLNHWAVVFDAGQWCASCDEAFQGRSPRQNIADGALQSYTSLKTMKIATYQHEEMDTEGF